jgi:hypothetical protein
VASSYRKDESDNFATHQEYVGIIVGLEARTGLLNAFFVLNLLKLVHLRPPKILEVCKQKIYLLNPANNFIL